MLKLLASVLASDAQDGNGLQLEKLRLNFSSCNFPHIFKKSTLMAMVCFLLLDEGYYLPLDVPRQCSEWIKLATTNFRIV